MSLFESMLVPDVFPKWNFIVWQNYKLNVCIQADENSLGSKAMN